MIVLDEMQQGSIEWAMARIGIPTASQFHRIVTPTGKLSGQRQDYLCELIAEWASNRPEDDFQGTYWTERGAMMEDRARSYYEFVREGCARRVGFIYRDEDRLVGCSPDWLVGSAPWATTVPQEWVAGAELKCPKARTHVRWMLMDTDDMPSEHRAQVQGCMWVTGLERWDFVSYHPDHPPVIVSVEQDPDYQAALDEAIPTFIEEMLRGRERYEERRPRSRPAPGA